MSRTSGTPGSPRPATARAARSAFFVFARQSMKITSALSITRRFLCCFCFVLFVVVVVVVLSVRFCCRRRIVGMYVLLLDLRESTSSIRSILLFMEVYSPVML